MLHARYEHPLRRHPAGPDVRIYDHERRRSSDPGILHFRRHRTGRRQEDPCRYHSERYSEGIHGT